MKEVIISLLLTMGYAVASTPMPNSCEYNENSMKEIGNELELYEENGNNMGVLMAINKMKYRLPKVIIYCEGKYTKEKMKKVKILNGMLKDMEKEVQNRIGR